MLNELGQKLYVTLREWAREHPGAAGSLILHLLIFLLIVGNFSFFYDPPPPPQILTATLEPLPIKEKRNLKPVETPPTPPAPEPPKEIKKEPEAKAPNPIKEPKPIVKPEAAKKPEPEKPAVIPKTKPEAMKSKKPEQKQPEEKPAKPEKSEKPEKAKTSDDFSSVLKSVEELSARPKAAPQPDNYNPNAALSDDIKNAIARQLMACWRIESGAINAGDTAVRVKIKVAQDGTINDVRLSDGDKQRYQNSSDPVYRVAVENALRAPYTCKMLKGLPLDQYSLWKELEFNFDPREMFYQTGE